MITIVALSPFVNFIFTSIEFAVSPEIGISTGFEPMFTVLLGEATMSYKITLNNIYISGDITINSKSLTLERPTLIFDAVFP